MIARDIVRVRCVRLIPRRARGKAMAGVQPAVVVAYVSSRVNRMHSRVLRARRQKSWRPSAQACQKPFVSFRERETPDEFPARARAAVKTLQLRRYYATVIA